MTNNALTLRRIVKARRAMMNARNTKFQAFWANVAEALQKTHG